MKNRTFLYFLLIGVLFSPLLADSEQSTSPEPSHDGNETVKVDGSFTRFGKSGDILPDFKLEISNNSRKFQLPAENESSIFKSQKIKKKILISNLKNATEKLVLGNEKLEKQVFVRGNGTVEGLKVESAANVTEDYGVGRTNVTEGRKTNTEDSNTGSPTQNDTFEPESEKEERTRSFQDGDIRRTFKYFNRKNKVTTSTTENYGSKYTTNSYMYFTLGEVQKAVNNNYLNINADLGKSSKTQMTSSTPSLGTTSMLPNGHSTSISDGQSVKNLVRLEDGHHGQTERTDWKVIAPVKSVGTSASTHKTAAVTVKPPTTQLFVKPITPITIRRFPTTEAIYGVTETVASTTPASNAIPKLDLDEESTRSNFLKLNRTLSGQAPNRKLSDIQRVSKLRGSVRFQSPASNASIETYEKVNGVVVNNATGDGLQKLEIPPTGIWDVAAVQDFAPVRLSTTESPEVTSKSVEALASPKPTNESSARPKNIAKVQVLKNTISDKVSSDNPMSIFKFSETEPPNNISKPSETSTSVPTSTVPENVSTVVMTQSTTPKNDSSDSERRAEDDQIELTLSREILKISTIPPRPATNTVQNDVTTIKIEPTTTEESITVPLTEKEPLYTTEEPVPEPETTFRSITEQESETSTDITVDEIPVPPKQPGPSNGTTASYPVKQATERENDILVDPELNYPWPNSTETDLAEITPEYHPPIHPSVLHEITEENVPAYLKLTVEAASWEELCRLKDDLKNAIIRMLDGTNVTAEAIVFLNLNDKNCRKKIEETKNDPHSNMPMYLPVNMFIMNDNGDFDKNLSEAFLNVWGQYGLDFELPIRKVDFLSPLGGLYDIPNDSAGVSVIAAIVISCVAGLCVILLGILFVVMKRRQKRFNYGQRCTPVSLDAYSLDSVSIHNSVRRKGIRTSKRSYGNAAFDDPEIPSHQMNFAGLANFSSDKEQLYEEFNIIPQVYPKTDELPAGAETKNRYANVIPLPETRVHLSVKDGDALSDYINANYVRGLKGAEKLYIACQAPMESTVEDFWRMIWEQQCKVIIMLTDLKENGVEKCTDYLPPNEVTDNLRLFGDFQITMKKRDVKEKYIISHLKVKNMEGNLWRELTHLWYLGWPEQGVPAEANSLIAFLIEARSQMKSQTGSTTQAPAVVHCSPGTGRTGTVIACDLCIREFEQTRMVDIPKCVFNLRKDRAGSVQTKDQYAFIYQVLNVYAAKLTGGGLESI